MTYDGFPDRWNDGYFGRHKTHMDGRVILCVDRHATITLAADLHTASYAPDFHNVENPL